MSFKVVDRFLPRVTRKKTKTVSNLILEGGKEKKSKVKSESSSRKKRGRREVGKARKKTKEREREEGYASSCRRESRVALRNCTFQMRVTFVRARHDEAKEARRKSERARERK